MTPYDYQGRDIEHLVSLYRSGLQGAVNGSDPGTGKTLVAVEVMKALNNPATLSVCPKAVMPAWDRAAKSQGTDITAINYEMLRTGRTPYGIWRVPPGCLKPRFAWSRGVEFLIFDEAHRCKGLDSDTSELMRAAKRQGIRTLAMSGTLADSPLDMDALGFLLGFHDSREPQATLKKPNPVSFHSWARKFGCYGNPMQGIRFQFRGSEESKRKHMATLHAQLFPGKGVRTRIDDIPGFPEMQITAELYALDDPARVDALYAEMRDALALLQTRAAFDKAPEHPMTALLRARQQVELLKVPVFVSLAEDAIEQGMTVLIFVNFCGTLIELCKRLNTDCFIDGTQTGPAGAIRREANRLRIQNDEARVLVGISEAAGVGIDLHDITGKHPRLELISAPWSAKTVKQLLGRPRRAGAKSKSLARFIFADGTVEVGQHAKLACKLDCLDALNDGDLEPGNLQVTGRL